MTSTIENQILDKVKKARRGSLFFGDSFISKENPEGVRKALQRLVKKGELHYGNKINILSALFEFCKGQLIFHRAKICCDRICFQQLRYIFL